MQRLFQQRQQAPQVIARRELRHHTAEGAVQLHLAPELMRDEAALLIEQRDRTLITGGLHAENEHAGALNSRGGGTSSAPHAIDRAAAPEPYDYRSRRSE